MKLAMIIALTIGGLSSAAPCRAEPAPIRYVALGSSYAAGLGLGDQIGDAPKPCMRGSGSYPRRLARMIGARLIDASCSGSTASQILGKGQAGLPPQIDAVTTQTDLVTITVGGNDLDYAGDMMRAAGLFGGLKSPLAPAQDRPYAKLKATIIDVLTQVRQRARQATIVLATYPDVVPQHGSCTQLSMDPSQAKVFRAIAARLAATSREAAAAVKGTVVVDVAKLSKGHDACSSSPWTTGGHPAIGFAYHPTAAGAEAVATEIKRHLDRLPARS